MSTKRRRTATESKSKRSQKDGWTTLSWDDLTDWAGSRSVSRGRAYQSQGRVDDLAISEDGWLLASVTGGERYTVTVWCDQEQKKGGVLYSRCTCPVGTDGCKHAVAVVAEYLKLLGEDAEIPAAVLAVTWKQRAADCFVQPCSTTIFANSSRLWTVSRAFW